MEEAGQREEEEKEGERYRSEGRRDRERQRVGDRIEGESRIEMG